MVDFHANPFAVYLETDAEGEWYAQTYKCSACQKMNVQLINGKANYSSSRIVLSFITISSMTMVRPRGSARPPCPPVVPHNLACDYIEACTVFADSPKAAAALGRRCLQNLLRDTAKVKRGDLNDEIQQVLDSGKLPSALYDSIDAIRNIGNFAAHPTKSKQTGLILDVEPGEAEWTLDVLEELFDFYFVLPDAIQKKKNAFNKKLQEAGKPLMK